MRLECTQLWASWLDVPSQRGPMRVSRGGTVLIVRTIARELFALVETRYGHAQPTWTRSIEIPGDDDFPVLELPIDHLRYSTERGYVVTFAARTCEGKPLLIAQVESFLTAGHDEAQWAIPAAYTPRGDDQRISQALEFDEGWEDAEFECAFISDARFAVFWRAAVLRKRFGLTCPHIKSLYPVSLGERELEPLDDVLAAWHRLPS